MNEYEQDMWSRAYERGVDVFLNTDVLRLPLFDDSGEVMGMQRYARAFADAKVLDYRASMKSLKRDEEAKARLEKDPVDNLKREAQKIIDTCQEDLSCVYCGHEYSYTHYDDCVVPAFRKFLKEIGENNDD